jgi:hypothetical protein
VFQTSGCFKCHTIGGGGDTQVAGGFPGGPGGQGGPPPGGFGPGGKGGRGGPGGFGPGGFKGMMKKVDLGHVGKEHDVPWIEQHVRDPKSQNPQSRMPRFDENRINDPDLRKLAEYLASLK